ncbi:MAG TPA: carbohydrate binding domain-containing protein [Ignavibacteriaceae bacterium]|jgi:hypothetical protein|nr:carbohydrate binding domain-containing protein [Ignavibacteriaceae bacterium]HOJ18544.1 carbohydrate binding domain-containing protein [Ignavibacteriaceae bacterium]HPO55501.1 carbohydrate binding domain-containing protein [Ignavibacteriaceae bacterium]
MKNKGIIIFFLIAVVVISAIIWFIGTIFSPEKEEKPKEIPLDEVEITRNHLRNHSFESEFTPADWRIISNHDSYVTLFDNAVRKDGNYSLQLNSDKEGDSFVIAAQSLKKVEAEMKYIFFALIKAEEADSVKLEIRATGEKDSLIIAGVSEVIKGTTDWQMLVAWVRTTNPKIIRIEAAAMLMGRGRMWIDDCKLYKVPVEYPFSRIDFGKLLQEKK